MLTLYGTTTSPYVRRARVVAMELGLPHELVNTAVPDGQSRLQEVTPIWKIPVAELDGQVIFDSRVIVETLMRDHGPGPLRELDASPAAANLVTVVDGALDALINAFYLAKDGVDRARVSYLDRQHERAKSALGWLEPHLGGPHLGAAEKIGLPEIALLSALDWMRFREAYPIDDHPALVAFFTAHAERPSIAATNPRL